MLMISSTLRFDLRFEEPTPAGKSWCWVHWRLDVRTFELLNAHSLQLRAWDEAMNTQPAVPGWNLLGDGNNCEFRVKVGR